MKLAIICLPFLGTFGLSVSTESWQKTPMSTLTLMAVLDLFQIHTQSEAACFSCLQQVPSTASCYQTNACNFTKCYEDGNKPNNFTAFVDTCCPQCADAILTTANCFSGCLPSCVRSTAIAFGSCASFPYYNCKETCQAYLLNDTSAGTAVARSAVPSSNSFFGNVGSQFQFGSSFNSSNLGDIICNVVDEVFNTTICPAARCCPYCIEQFDALEECILNDVLLGQVFQMNTSCTIDCGTNKKWIPSFRSLQTSNTNNNGPNLTQVTAAYDAIQTCQNLMSAYRAVNMNEAAYQAYVSCIQSALITLPVQAMNNTSPSSSAGGSSGNTNSNTPSGSAWFGTMGATMATMMYSFTVFAMGAILLP